MKNKIILALSIFLLSSCGNLKELSSVDFLENYDKEILTLNLSNTQLEELPDFTQYATGEWVQEVETIDLSNNSILSI